MSHGIVQSIKFSTKLVDAMANLLGPRVIDVADKLVPKEEREQWLNCKQGEAVNTYIKNMRFTTSFLETLKHEHGSKIAEITSDLMSKEEHIRWCSVAKQVEDHSIENFIRLVWEPLIPLGFKFTVEKREDGTQLHCSSCPIHELSKVIGGAEWLAILECNKDLHNVAGFNSNIGFKRTQTLIKGDSHCDHFYYEKN
jgi:predicted ArsR family transcriptional regulator